MKKYLGFGLLLLAVACQKPAGKSRAAKNKFSDQNLRTLYTLQDERNASGLLTYFNSSIINHRKEAALALASVQDKATVPALSSLLSDPEPPVRKAAAFALGQIADSTAESQLVSAIDQESDSFVRAEMFEALGRCATRNGIAILAYFDTPDTVTQGGQAWGLYRAMLRKPLPEPALTKVARLLTREHPYQVRLAAAHTLARSGKADLRRYFTLLQEAARNDKSAYVRAAATSALGKAKMPESAEVLTFLAVSDPDYRVRLSAVRALKEQEYALSKPALLKALSDVHPHVGLTAAEVLAAKNQETADTFWQAALLQPDWRTRAVLLGACLKASQKPEPVRQHLTSLYRKTSNVYEKGALLAALSNNPASYEFLKTETFSAKDPVISTYGIEALATLRKQPDFPESLNTDFDQLLKNAIASSDVAIIGTAATLLREPSLNYRQTFTDVAFLKTAMAKLTLPRDVEPYIELQKTIAFLLEKPAPEPPKTQPKQPIDWKLVQRLSPDQKVLLKTSKGDITLQLYVEDAPGSVANFVQLLEKDFYNGKFFHRVVPNFVAQGGDPRGDGWGGTDYTIRSDFADLHYLEGTVGMASAGKDTESCQWFITHNYVPHLDGRYSIFARVISGFEVVHKLQISDKIEKVELVKQ
jgi:cyclophilin family peptidyl-prolyl cis-trans isomerase/HEAT repeat protein